MRQRNDRARSAILAALQEGDEVLGAARLAEKIQELGITLRPRTVRMHLLQMDQEGLTQFVGRRQGREITEKGRQELARANVIEKVGFVAAKVDVMGYRMTFSLDRCAGSVIINTALINRRDFARSVSHMEPVFAAGLGMGQHVAMATEGEQLGASLVPQGMLALGTVCSVTVNGLLLNRRIPVTSRFGGLVEMRDGKPYRFVELIEYRGTTLDPLEIFIRSGMTQVTRCARTGNGIIGASFREVPSVAMEEVHGIWKQMEKPGLGNAILMVGKPNRPLLDIPVSEGRTGIIVVGGLNPLAALHEAGIPTTIQSLSSLEDFSRLCPFRDLALRIPRRTQYVE